MIKSMTGFASLQGILGDYIWTLEIRTVNARNLDIRLRLPSWVEPLDPMIRRELASTIRRGSVSLTAKVHRCSEGMNERLDKGIMQQRISQIAEIEATAERMNVALAKTSAAEILALDGVLSQTDEKNPETLKEALVLRLHDLIEALDSERRNEGIVLSKILDGQIARIETLAKKAKETAEARSDQVAEKLRARLESVMDRSETVDDARLEQEIALIAVKVDVTEEIDRLQAHVCSARDLLATEDAAGRKLDFLAQEFNREANTLCAKAQSSELARLGLDLKATIDQMREQLQNVE